MSRAIRVITRRGGSEGGDEESEVPVALSDVRARLAGGRGHGCVGENESECLEYLGGR